MTHNHSKEPSSCTASGKNQLHSSAAAPRQSEAFKRLGQASLVSSSIFKSAPSTPNQPSRPALNHQPSTVAQTAAHSTPGSRISFTQHRASVTSSPFKASGSDPSINKSTCSSSEHLNRTTSSLPSTSFTPSSEGDEASSHDSDVAPGTPPLHARPDLPVPPTSPRAGGSANGVLKTQKLGGPQSFTPPHASRSSGYASEPKKGGQDCRAPSALSCPNRRRELRKTVTWGGEDVLELEWEEEWRRTSNASSSDSQISNSKPKDTSDISTDSDLSEAPQALIDHPNPKHQSHPSEFWNESSGTTTYAHQAQARRWPQPQASQDLSPCQHPGAALCPLQPPSGHFQGKHDPNRSKS
ncbi:hypothetical protein PTTG_06977 [Puccinia triticina 1-1 BBBD Race 1]|uniref:Uncharacterized protein n=1 Tax=Puccinia triticina (isolate 1-1 / race 1 (BBBD)) TaxID=630390 RepID=A0A180G8B1_PUCT1|nr:hypothetical protein PTTG_06977 [Puccinia triticina 1-1 BBBD Race 1]